MVAEVNFFITKWLTYLGVFFRYLMKFDVVDPAYFIFIQQALHLVILLFAPFV